MERRLKRKNGAHIKAGFKCSLNQSSDDEEFLYYWQSFYTIHFSSHERSAWSTKRKAIHTKGEMNIGECNKGGKKRVRRKRRKVDGQKKRDEKVSHLTT